MNSSISKKPKKLQFAVHHRPWIQEDGFDIEKDEHDRHQVELDAETFARAADGDSCRSRRACPSARSPHVLAEHDRERRSARPLRGNDHDLDQDREVQLGV